MGMQGEGNSEGFERVMKMARERFDNLEAGDLSDQVKSEVVGIYNSMAGYYFGLSRFRPEGEEQNNFIHEATEYINKADKIEMYDTATWTTKAFCLLWSHNLERAVEFFKNTL